MKFFKLCALVFALGFTYGCQTVSDRYGSGELTLSKKQDEAYRKYLAVFSIPEKRGSSSVFMIDPYSGGYSYGSGGRQISNAVTHIQEVCGPNCKIFATNRQIVWEGFLDAAKYESAKIDYEKYAEYPLSYYDVDKYKISYSQKSKLGDISSTDSYHKATAISIDGKTVSQYSSQHSRWHKRHKLERTALVSCLAASNGKDCYVYSYDGKIYNQ